MARRRKEAEKALPLPPFHLAQAAADHRQMWCLDVHRWDGRRVRVGTLDRLEPLFCPHWDGAGVFAPDERAYLFPIRTSAEMIRYKRLERYGRTKWGWEASE
jgi:hypothetical protein